MAVAEDCLRQQLFEESLAAVERADKCYGLMSTALVDRMSKTGGKISRKEVTDFRELVPNEQARAAHRVQFVEALNKCTSALADAQLMARSFFKRAWAENRLKTAQEALKHASKHLEESCPPAQLGMAHIKMLLERRARSAASNSSNRASISVFGAGSPTTTRAPLGTANLLILAEDGDSESRLQTGESQTDVIGSAPLSDRTRTEIVDLVMEGQKLMDHLPEDAALEITDALNQSNSPVAMIIRRKGPQSPDVSIPMNSADVQGLDELNSEGADLIARLPESLAQEVLSTMMHSHSPVADVMRRSNSPLAEIFRVQSPHSELHPSEALMPATPGDAVPQYVGPANLARLPGEPTPPKQEYARDLDFDVLNQLLVMCGISNVSIPDLQKAVAQVKVEYAESANTWEEEENGVLDEKQWNLRSDMELEDYGSEAELLPRVYNILHSNFWLDESKESMERTRLLHAALAEQVIVHSNNNICMCSLHIVCVILYNVLSSSSSIRRRRMRSKTRKKNSRRVPSRMQGEKPGTRRSYSPLVNSMITSFCARSWYARDLFLLTWA